VRLIFLTVNEDADFARAALDAGGLGYVVKASLASDLLPAIRA
jgi:DNA-binding NarL/FixJ family response regulator